LPESKQFTGDQVGVDGAEPGFRRTNLIRAMTQSGITCCIGDNQILLI
jgi:hypothetical protein